MSTRDIAQRIVTAMDTAEALAASAVTWRELEAAAEAVSLARSRISSDAQYLHDHLEMLADDLRDREIEWIEQRKWRREKR
jgi:hypothetical protein